MMIYHTAGQLELFLNKGLAWQGEKKAQRILYRLKRSMTSRDFENLREVWREYQNTRDGKEVFIKEVQDLIKKYKSFV